MLTCEDFENLAASIGVGGYHLMLVGDGSGMTRRQPCGWHCNLYYRPSRQITHVCGAASNGTNNFAELTPYLHALWVFHTAWREKHPVCGPDCDVLVVTDSEVTARCGSGQYQRKANQALWASLDWYAANGYRFTWKHVPRNTNPASRHSDKVSGRARQSFADFLRALVDGSQ